MGVKEEEGTRRSGGVSRQTSFASQLSQDSISSSITTGDQESGVDELWGTWDQVLVHWNSGSSSKSAAAGIKELVRRGIPHHIRGMAWQVREVYL